MSLITMEMLKVNYDPKISMPMSQYAKAIVSTRNETVDKVLEILSRYRLRHYDGKTHKSVGAEIKAEVEALKVGDEE